MEESDGNYLSFGGATTMTQRDKVPEVGEVMVGRGLCVEYDAEAARAIFTRKCALFQSRVWDVVCFYDSPNGRQIQTYHTAKDARRFLHDSL